MSSDNNEEFESKDKMSSDAIKKLNDAFSSYLDGKEPEDIKEEDAENDSLLELVQQGIAEKQKEVSESVSEEETVVEPDELFVEEVNEAASISDPDGSITEEIKEKIPDVLSGVFDDVQFQSVELEIPEIEETADEADSHYSKIAAEIVSKSPKKQVKAVLSETRKEVPLTPLPEKEKTTLVSSPEQKMENTDDHNIVVSRAFVKKSKATSMPEIEVEKPLQKTVAQKIISEERAAVPVKSIPITEEKSKLLNSKSPSENISSAVTSDDIKEPEVSEKKAEKMPEKKPEQKPAPAKKTENTVPEGDVSIAFLYNKDHTSHDASSLSMNTHERPERVIKAMWYLEKNKVFEDGTCTLIEKFDMADEADLLRVHEDSYVSFVRNYASAGGGFLGDSTYMTKTSYDVAKMAVGAAISAGDLIVDRKYSHAFVLARPPGHHASTEKYGGFCLFNNAGILARYLQKERGVGKVLILDWDAHAGDGTMEIFYEDPTVMFMSLHRDPHGFYPRKGFSEQVGEGAGKGYTLNVEMPEGSGNEEYYMAFDEVILPLIEHFSPEIIIFSCGFDAYYKEKNIGLVLDSEGYHQMTSKILSIFSGPMIFLMEGGYHDSNGQLCHSVLSALHGKPNPVSDKQQITSYQQNLRKKLFEEAQKKVAESKKKSPVLSSKVSE